MTTMGVLVEDLYVLSWDQSTSYPLSNNIASLAFAVRPKIPPLDRFRHWSPVAFSMTIESRRPVHRMQADFETVLSHGYRHWVLR